MKKQIIILIIAVGGLLMAQAPDTLTLEYCQNRARENFPLHQQFKLLKSAAELKINNLTKNWFPQLTINGQSTYQSDVATLPLHVPGVTIAEVDKAIYKVTLDISNTLYDGGLTRRQKLLENTSLSVDKQNVEVELYKLREQINQIYFNALLLQENENLLNNLKDEIKSRLKIVESSARNGLVLQSNADVMQAEMIKIEQQLLEIVLSKQAALEMLSEYIDQPITHETVLTVPVFNTVSDEPSLLRPELKLLNLQMEKLDASRSLFTAKVLPHLVVFGQFGYGKPGLNMFSNELNDFYIVGLKINWTPWNWRRTRNDRQWIDLQKNIVQTQKSTLEQNIRILLKKDITEINKYKLMILKDDEIIALRKNITNISSAQLDNGIITATDYLVELNAETQASLNKQLHIIQLAKAKVNYQYDYGIKE
ncbi:TolC family protein [Candidatus Neomarinimicrobiota bacterium]